jgi:AcrR family transcriptional regulator
MYHRWHLEREIKSVATEPREITPEPPGKMEDSKKERIVAEAIRLFCEKGYEATSVREIVEAVGVTKPVLYYYFKNKDELFRHVIETAMDPFDEAQTEICARAGTDFWDKLGELVDLHIHWAVVDPDRVRFLHAIFFSGLYKDVFDFEGQWRVYFEVVRALFHQAQEEGVIRDDISDESLTAIFTGMAHEAMRSRVYCPGLVQIPPTSKEVVSIIKEGIAK